VNKYRVQHIEYVMDDITKQVKGTIELVEHLRALRACRTPLIEGSLEETASSEKIKGQNLRGDPVPSQLSIHIFS
jgi:hypothetical protein